MILVTGATGQFGRQAIQSLLDKGVNAKEIIALVRNAEAAADIQQSGVGIAIGDYDNYPSLVNAFKGVEKVLFVSGSDVAKRLAQHENVINAAKEAGVQHIVYTSFQRKDESEASPLWIVAQSHIATENALMASGIAYTLLRNNLYMDFLPGFIGEQVLESGTVFVPAGTGKISAVLRSEMAEGAATILITPNHEGKTYDFSNTASVSYHDIVATLSEISGKEINYVSPSPEDYVQALTGFGLPAEAIGIFTGFAVAQALGELDVVSTDLEQLLGRKPVSVELFLKNVYGMEHY